MSGDSVVRDLEGPASVLVTGTSSGVGRAALEQLLDNAGVERVFAVSRSATSDDGLCALRDAQAGRLILRDVDLTREEQVQALADDIAEQVRALHLVFNAAGMLHAGALQPEKTVRDVHMDNLQRVFALNAFAPIVLAGALLPLFKHRQSCVFASLSARIGSIGDNRMGGWYAYRASKAAQNQLLKTFAIELGRTNRRAACLLLHPGTVDTPLSAPFQTRVPADKLFSPARAARQLLDIIAASGPERSGQFIAWDDTPIEW